MRTFIRSGSVFSLFIFWAACGSGTAIDDPNKQVGLSGGGGGGGGAGASGRGGGLSPGTGGGFVEAGLPASDAGVAASGRDALKSPDGMKAADGAAAAVLPAWETLIDRSRLHQIKIICPESDVPKIETLKGADAFCDVTFDDVVLASVAISQKGSVYSGCRCIKVPCTAMCQPNSIYKDQLVPGLQQPKPGLKLKFDAKLTAQRLFGLKRLVLNNAHQDLSFMSADITYEVYRRAGLRAPRTAFGQVSINGIPQGLYNIEEALDKQMLQRNFGNGDGNLYEGSNYDFVVDPDAKSPTRTDALVELKNEVSEMRRRDDLYALSAAILGVPNATFETALSKILDLDGFMTSWAIDAVCSHRDNYIFGANNYIIYNNPSDGRFVFIPHGDDSGFGVQYKIQSVYPVPRGVTGGSLGRELAYTMLPMAIQDIPALYAKYKAAVARVSSVAVWDTKVLFDRIVDLDRLLMTMAKPDPRMTADIEQFKKHRPTVETFIKQRALPLETEKKALASGVQPAANQVPVIFTSDLFYPPQIATSDAVVSIAVLMSMPEVDLKGVVLGNGLMGKDRPQVAAGTGVPGANIMGQLQTILRHRTPSYIGLNRALTGLGDQVLEDEKRFQGGVSFILDTLQNSANPVTIVTVGSLRDVAAAFNRQPDLFRQKVGKVLVFAGEAASTPAGLANQKEGNVDLDPFAFAAIMKSGLPVFWVPAVDGGYGPEHPSNLGNASAWTAPLGQVLEPLFGPTLQYFVNAFGGKTNSAVMKLIASGVSGTEKAQVVALSKDLISAAVLAAVADKTVTYDGALAALADGLLAPPANAVFGFLPVEVTVSDKGYVTSYGAGTGARKVQRFSRRVAQDVYAKAMSQMTGKMLVRLMPIP